jgi:hypothetical protein
VPRVVLRWIFRWCDGHETNVLTSIALSILLSEPLFATLPPHLVFNAARYQSGGCHDHVRNRLHHRFYEDR